MSSRPTPPQHHNTKLISQSFSNIVHPSTEFDVSDQWIGPFKAVINTKGLLHETIKGEIDPTLNNCCDEQSDVLATLSTLASLAIPSGTIIELGSTSDLKGRSSRIDSITAGNLFASILTSPEAIPCFASLDFDDDHNTDPQTDSTTPTQSTKQQPLCQLPLNDPSLPSPTTTTFPNLLADNILYISPQIAAQLGYTPTEYAHLPLDQLICNNNTHTCAHPAQFVKTQTDFAQHKAGEAYSEDHILSLSIPLEKQIYIRIATLPRIPARNFMLTHESDKTPNQDAIDAIIPTQLRLDESPRELRVAQRGVFYLLPALNNFPNNVLQDILHRYFSTPLKHQNNPLIRGRQLHVGSIFAVPVTIQEEDRLYHQSIEEKAEDHDEENMASVPGSFFPTDCLFFFCAQLECDKNIYTATDDQGTTLYDSDDMLTNAGHHNNFLTCRLQRSTSPSVQDARAMMGMETLKNPANQPARAQKFLTTESIDVHRTTSYMLIDVAQTEFIVHSFNLTCLRPSLFQHLYAVAVANQSNYSILTQLAIKHALLSSSCGHAITNACCGGDASQQQQDLTTAPQFLPNGQLDLPLPPETPTITPQESLLQLLHKHPTLLFNIPILDSLLLRGYGSSLTNLIEAILPTFYSPHTFIMPLIQSTHTKNSKATLLRALSYLLHLDYIEIDTDQVEGLMSEGDLQYVSNAMSAVINIRNIGVDTIVPPLPARRPGIVNSIYILTASCSDTPKHVLATDVINLPLPSPTPRTRIYLYEFLSKMTFNNTYKQPQITTDLNNNNNNNTNQLALKQADKVLYNDISCQQLSAMMICAYVGLTGYTNAPTQSVALLSQAILVKSINAFKSDREMYSTCLKTKQDMLLTCHCHVLCNMLQHNNVASGIPNVSWKDIGAAGTIRKELMQLIKPKAAKASDDGLGNAFSLQRRGVLLYGPPGSGKTLVAKALAGESGIGFVTANAGEILSMYIGESEKKIRDLFINARNSAPCVLFLDEIDSLAPSKNNAGNSGGGGVMQRIVSQLLLEIDALNDDGIDVFLVGATNRPELLDLSLLRPGRLDRSIYVGISNTVDDQLQILKALTRKFKLGPKVDLRKIIEAYCISRPLTGADFFALASTSMTLAIMDAVNNVEREKAGEVINLDDDDYDVEDDPDPIVPKVSVSKQIGNLDRFANSDLINKTLTASSIGGASGSNTGLPSVTCAPDMSQNNTTMPNSTMDVFGEAPKAPKKQRDLYNFGRETTTTPAAATPAPAPVVDVPAIATTPTIDAFGNLQPAKKTRKKKNPLTDGILDFGVPLDITTPEPTPPAPTPTEAPTSTAPTTTQPETIPEPTTSTTPAPEPTPTPAPVPAKKTRKKKDLDVLSGILSFDGCTPVNTTSTTTEPTPTPTTSPTEETPAPSTTTVASTDERATEPTITPPTTTTPDVDIKPATLDVLGDMKQLDVLGAGMQLLPTTTKKKRAKKSLGVSLFDIPGISATPVDEEVVEKPQEQQQPPQQKENVVVVVVEEEKEQQQAHDVVETPVEDKVDDVVVSDKSDDNNNNSSNNVVVEEQKEQPEHTHPEEPVINETPTTTPVENPTTTTTTTTDDQPIAIEDDEKQSKTNTQPGPEEPTTSTTETEEPTEPKITTTTPQSTAFEVIDAPIEDDGPTLSKPMKKTPKKAQIAKSQLLSNLFSGNNNPLKSLKMKQIGAQAATKGKGKKPIGKKGKKSTKQPAKEEQDNGVSDNDDDDQQAEDDDVDGADDAVENGDFDEEQDLDEGANEFGQDGDEDDEDDEFGLDGDNLDEDLEEDEDDENELFDDGDEFIPLPSYAGVQLQYLIGDGQSNANQTNVDPDQPFKFQDDSDDDDDDAEYESDADEFEIIDDNHYEEFYDNDNNEGDEDVDISAFLAQTMLLQQDLEEIAAEERAQVAQSVALRGVVVYQKHFIQAAKKLTPSLSKEELDHYKKIREQFSSKRAKKLA